MVGSPVKENHDGPIRDLDHKENKSALATDPPAAGHDRGELWRESELETGGGHRWASIRIWWSVESEEIEGAANAS